MSAGRWQQINQIFHDALERDAATRDTYLQEATAGDAELLREVRTLLTSHAKAGEFLDRPAWEVAPHLALGDDASLVGKRIGTYHILEEVGRGGWASSTPPRTKLRRTVAFKALPAEYTRDPLRRERLTREARAPLPSCIQRSPRSLPSRIDGELTSPRARSRSAPRGAA